MSDNLREAAYRLIVGVEREADDHAGQRINDYDDGFYEGTLSVIQDLKRIMNEFPEPETTTEWGTRKVVNGELVDLCCYEDEATARIFKEDEELITRQVTAWKKADQ